MVKMKFLWLCYSVLQLLLHIKTSLIPSESPYIIHGFTIKKEPSAKATVTATLLLPLASVPRNFKRDLHSLI